MPYGEWILASKQLPQPGVPVLVFEKEDDRRSSPMFDTMRVATYRDYDRGFFYNVPMAMPSNHQALNVTHWMPLPDKPV